MAEEEKIDEQKKIAEENKREELKKAASFVTALKEINATQKTTALSTDQIAKYMASINVAATQRTDSVKTQVTKMVAPVIEEELTKIAELLGDPDEKKQEQALDIIDKLEDIGVNIKDFSKELGQNVDKLTDSLKKRKEIKEEKLRELTIERDNIREKLKTNLVINKDTMKLEVITKSQEKMERKELQQLEDRIKRDKREYLEQEKKIREKETITETDRKILQDRREKMLADEQKAEETRDRLNIKPGEKMGGFIGQTFGEAISQVKAFGKDLSILGKNIVDGIKNAPRALMNFAGAVGRGAVGMAKFTIGLLIGSLKFIAIGLIIGLVIFGLYKLYSALKRIGEKISNFFSFGKKEKKDLAEGTGKAGDVDPMSAGGDTDTKVPKTAGNISQPPAYQGEKISGPSAEYEAEKQSITGPRIASRLDTRDNAMQGESAFLRRKRERDNDMPLPGEFAKSSADMVAQKESGARPSNAAVIAPNNVVNNNSTTSVISMEPGNPDKSFLNLSSVPV